MERKYTYRCTRLENAREREREKERKIRKATISKGPEGNENRRSSSIVGAQLDWLWVARPRKKLLFFSHDCSQFSLELRYNVNFYACIPSTGDNFFFLGERVEMIFRGREEPAL